METAVVQVDPNTLSVAGTISTSIPAGYRVFPQDYRSGHLLKMHSPNAGDADSFLVDEAPLELSQSGLYGARFGQNDEVVYRRGRNLGRILKTAATPQWEIKTEFDSIGSNYNDRFEVTTSTVGDIAIVGSKYGQEASGSWYTHSYFAVYDAYGSLRGKADLGRSDPVGIATDLGTILRTDGGWIIPRGGLIYRFDDVANKLSETLIFSEGSPPELGTNGHDVGVAFSNGEKIWVQLRSSDPEVRYWERVIEAPDAVVRSVAVDGKGDVYVLGTYTKPIDFAPGLVQGDLLGDVSQKYFLAKFSGRGNAENQEQQGSRSVDPSVVEPFDLVVTEFMANPSACSDNVGEWIEIYNASAKPVSLHGLLLKDKAAHSVSISSSTVLEPNRYAVIGRSASFCGSFVPDGWYDSALTLGNSGGRIQLLSEQAALIDEVTYGAVGGKSGISLVLKSNPDAALNDDPTSWGVSETLLPNGEKGTPGAAND